MNIFYSMQRNKKLRNNSQHHITILKLLFWVWKPPEKSKMGKPVQQSDIDFIMRKYGTFTITANSPKPRECSTPQNHWENPSLTSTPSYVSVWPTCTKLNDLTTHYSVFYGKSFVSLSLHVCILSLSKYKCVSSPLIDRSLINLDKVKALISLSL